MSGHRVDETRRCCNLFKENDIFQNVANTTITGSQGFPGQPMTNDTKPDNVENLNNIGLAPVQSVGMY